MEKLKQELNTLLDSKRDKKSQLQYSGSKGYNSGWIDGLLYALSEIDKLENKVGKYR